MSDDLSQLPRFYLPTITDTHAGIRNLLAAYLFGARHGQTVLDLRDCRFLSHAAYAFLVANLLPRTKGGNPHFRMDWVSVPEKLQDRFGNHLNWLTESEGAPDPGKMHEVPARMFSRDDDVIGYLKNHWLGHGWMKVSDKLRGALTSRAYEMFLNAFEHSQARLVYTCGSHSRQAKKLRLAIVDLGVGIPGTVRPYVMQEMERVPSDVQCLRWAMQKGATTKPGPPRGLGLDLLGEMVRLNDGRLDIYSHRAHALVTSQGQTVTKFDLSFPGTLVNITFRCDDLYYYLANEALDGPLF